MRSHGLLPLVAAATALTLHSPAAIPLQAQAGAAPCVPGYVWREAFPGDFTCVTPQVRAQAAADNARAAARREPGGGPYGPDTCRPGYVWRGARPEDHVCVTPATRAQAAADNAQAAWRRQTAPGGAAQVTDEFSWPSDRPVRVMMHETDGFCFVTRVTGAFKGFGENVFIYLDDQGSWVLGGQTQQPATGIGARCVRWSAFADAQRGAAHAIPGGYPDMVTGSNLALNVGDLGAICPLMGVAGDFRGGAEWVSVYPDRNRWHLRGNIASGSGVSARAICMQLDVRGRPGMRRPVRYAGRHSWSQDRHRKDELVRMLPTSEGICYLARVGGRLDGGGEYVAVMPINGFWWITGASGTHGVHAEAECVAFR